MQINHLIPWLKRRFTDFVELRKAARANGICLARAILRFIKLVGAPKYSPTEVFMLGFLGDDSLVKPATYVSKHCTFETQLRINPREYFPYTEDKLVFARLCIKHGLASPRIRAVVDPGGGTSTTRSRSSVIRHNSARLWQMKSPATWF